MLSDAIKQMRERLRDTASVEDPKGVLLTLRAFELEARNMEERIFCLTGRPHVALDGELMSAPSHSPDPLKKDHANG